MPVFFKNLLTWHEFLNKLIISVPTKKHQNYWNSKLNSCGNKLCIRCTNISKDESSSLKIAS